MKSNKTIRSRIKITRKGKMVSRRPGHGHFNVKSSGTKRITKRRTQNVKIPKKVKQLYKLS